MFNRVIISLFLIVIAVVLVCIVLVPRTRNGRVATGAWTHGLWDSKTKRLDTQPLSAFEQRTGKSLAIAHIYVGWHELDTNQFTGAVSELVKEGWSPLVSSNPYFHDTCISQGKTLYKSIAEGRCDAFLKRVAISMRDTNTKILFRFAWEMNIPANEWSLDYTGSQPADFVAAWRHMHDIFRREGAGNVAWVFAPNVRNGNSTDFREYYPGDAYVDWVGLDGYNWGSTQGWSVWQSFHDLFYESYIELSGIALEKPFIISEFGTTDQGGNKAQWYAAMLEKQIPQNFSRVRAIVFYDEDRRATEGADWRVDTSSDSLNAVRKALKNSIYTSDANL